MNISIFTGHLGADPELRVTTTDKPVLNLSVGVKVGWGDNEQTIWKRCQLWGERAEKLSPHLSKGSKVCIHADEYQEEWTDKESQKRKALKYTIRQIEFADSKNAAVKPAATTAKGNPDDIEEDVPF